MIPHQLLLTTHKIKFQTIKNRVMQADLSGKAAVVTAASKGLGRAVARELADCGARVVISSRSEENLQEAKSYIQEETGVADEMVLPLACDLGNPEEVKETMATAINELDGLDILVTNHGGTPRLSFDETTPEVLDEQYTAVLKSTFLAVNEALPALKDGGGSISHIVSTSAREPPKNHIPSNVLRPGIYGLSKSIANEYGEYGIRSNCVCPRMVMTDRIQRIFEQDAQRKEISMEEAKGKHVESLPLQRVGDPQEFAQAVAFLSSNAASYITGSILPIDGGWTREAF
jgi:3-oxoacyl-[acyl-carrier protein] reductase